MMDAFSFGGFSYLMGNMGMMNRVDDPCAYELGAKAIEYFDKFNPRGWLCKGGMRMAMAKASAKRTKVSRSAAIKNSQLPYRGGQVRYLPCKNWYPTQPLPGGPNKGFKDTFGNEWVKGDSRTKGERLEWDVQRPDGTHWNISLKGIVTH